MIQLNKTFFQITKRLALVVILVCTTTRLWAGEYLETHYDAEPKATVTIQTRAEGKVYAAQVNGEPDWAKQTHSATVTIGSSYTTTIESAPDWMDALWNDKKFFGATIPGLGSLLNQGASSPITTQTIFLYTQDISNEGYVFAGWYRGDENTEYTIKNDNGEDVHVRTYNAQHTINLKSDNSDNEKFIAKWLKPQVTGAGTVESFGTITDPTDIINAKNATFTIKDFNSVDNFVGSTSTNPINGTQPATAKGFQKVAGEAITNNTYTLPVTFIPTGIHGDVTGRAILKVKAHTGETTGEPTDNDWKYITLTAKEDYTPNFTEKSSYNFGTVSLGTSRPSNSELYPTTNNYAAGAAETSNNIAGTKWEYTIIQNGDADYSQYFTVTRGTKEPQVTFAPGSNKEVFGLGNTEGQNTKEISAKLQMRCTYYDAAGKALRTEYKYTTLYATVKLDLTSRLEFLPNNDDNDNDPTVFNFGEIEMGDNTKKVELLLDYANVSFADNACQLDNKNVLFNLQSNKPNGSIVTITIPDSESFDGCKEYTTTLTVTGTSTLPEENNKLLSCQITLSATLVLGDAPVVVGSGTNGKVTFTWNEIPGARSYEVYVTEANGTTFGDEPVITIPTGKEMKYEVSINNQQTVQCYVEAVNRTGCSTQSVRVPATAAMDWIDNTNKDNTGLKTGIGNGFTASGLPEDYQENRDIDLSAAFDASGNPIMDKLYIFGETTCASSNKIISKENAITPLLVYQKEVSEKGKGYRLIDKGAGTTVPNVRETRSSYLTINASGLSAIYFTGYCPFASTGNNNTEGVIHIVGGAQTLDIYLQDLQIYAMKNNGIININYKFFTDNIQKKGLIYHATGSGAAFAIESNSLSIENPFAVKMHIADNNKLDAAPGANISIDINQEGQTLLKSTSISHYSAPIQVLHLKDNTTTKLSIDDIWNGVHKYGSLSLQETYGDENDYTSIDLGNELTSLEISGGNIMLQNIAATYKMTSYKVSSEFFDAYGLHDAECPGYTFNKYTKVGNKIHLKDGTFNSQNNTSWYANSMFIDGGSYTYEPKHYNADNATNNTTIKNSNIETDGDGKVLNYVEISEFTNYGTPPESGERFEVIDFAQMVDDLFPDYGVDDQTNTGYHTTLSVYYNYAETPYGITNLFPHINKKGENYIGLMLPKLDCKDVKIAWQICSPNLTVETANGKSKLGGGIPYAAGCHVHQHPYTIDRLLHMEMDTYTQNALGDGYFPSPYAGGATISVEDPDGKPLYETIDNIEEYQVGKKVYMLVPIIADQWNLFAAPFDVANVYVIESYPEAQILKDFKTYHGMVHPDEVVNARKAQAERTLELYALWYSTIKNFGSNVDFFGSYVDANSDGTLDNTEKYGAFVNTWITYEENNNKNNEGGNYTPEICQLIHFNGSNANQAHYFLYKQNGEWEYTAATNENEEAKFKTSWIPVAAIPSATPNSTQAIMTKGNVYAMQFPYNIIGGTHDPATTWDYWTGKYLLIESTLKTGGDEVDANGKPINKHIISGSKFKESGMFNGGVEEGKAKLCGNATFAELSGISAPTGTSLWTLTKDPNQEIEVEVELEDGTKTTATVKRDVHKFTPMNADEILAPGQGIVVANFTAPKSMRAISINYRTGEVEYVKIDDENPDDDNPGLGSGLPTIMGDITLIVEPTSEGLTITPIKEQHVMLFDANGKMIFSKHLNAEENVTLPTGVYVVRGEYEQVKAIKK